MLEPLFNSTVWLLLTYDKVGLVEVCVFTDATLVTIAPDCPTAKARAVATFVPKPETPVETGKPVQLVNVPLVGVPRIGVTSVGDVESTFAPEPVDVVTPVPPLATASVPANVIVPDVVTGPPLVVKPVVPPLTLTLVTVPLPLLVALIV